MHRTRRCLSETPAPNEPRVSVQRLMPAAASGGNQSSLRCVRTTQHCRVGERRQQAVAPITVLPLRPAVMRKCWTSSSLAQRTRTSGTRSCSSRSCFVPVTAQNRSAEPPFQALETTPPDEGEHVKKPAREFRFVAIGALSTRLPLAADTRSGPGERSSGSSNARPVRVSLLSELRAGSEHAYARAWIWRSSRAPWFRRPARFRRWSRRVGCRCSQTH